MNDIALNLEKREVTGKKVAKLRQAGMVPSTVYGGSDEPINTQSEFVATTKVVTVAGKHTPVQLTIGGKKKLAIIKNIDRDPVKQRVRHVAFHAVKQDDIITTEVPIQLVGLGESEAEKAGLIVLQAIEQIEIKARPADLPEALELSITALVSAEDKLTLGDIKLPNGVEYADMDQDLDLVVANVYEPSALQAANDAAGGDATDDTPQDTADDSVAADAQADDAKTGDKSQEESK